MEKQSNYRKNSGHKTWLCLAIGCLGLLFADAKGEITDPLNDTGYLTVVSNCAVTANGTARMTITAAGASLAGWRETSTHLVRLRNYNDRVEVDPVEAIGAGQYAISIRFYNSSRQYLTEILWAEASGDLSTRVIPSVKQMLAAHSISNVEFYSLRFGLGGGIGDGFEFDEIRVLRGPGYWPPTPLTAAAPKAVFGHFMTGFRTPAVSGGWYNSWDNSEYVSHDPYVVDANGRPDIASVYYPSIGYYDMRDPKAVEYHCQCLKMACMDGIIFDLGFYNADSAAMASGYFSEMSEYGLKGVICFEDKVHWKWGDTSMSRELTVQATYNEMNLWMDLFLAGGVQYYVTGSRPLFLMFSYNVIDPAYPERGPQCLSPSEMSVWLNRFNPDQRPVSLRQWFQLPDFVGIFNGFYGWLRFNAAPPELAPYEDYCDLEGNRIFLNDCRDLGQSLIATGQADFHIPGVWPGFNDLEIWGWGDGPRLIPRYDGQLYEDTWQWAIEDNLPVVQAATWNDWFEGTNIEPSVEFGATYLEITSQKASEFKNLAGWTIPDFAVPVWIYRIRDITSDPCVLADMETACDSIKAGQFAAAEALVAPWAAYFDVDAVTYWTGPGSIATAPAVGLPSLCDFGTVEFGESDIIALPVANNGTQPLAFTGTEPVEILFGQAHFTVASVFDTGDLYVNQQRPLSIRFTPQGIGAKSGMLKVSTNDPVYPNIYCTLQGTGIYKTGDWSHDGVVNLEDMAWLSQCWLDGCGLSELAALAENWLE